MAPLLLLLLIAATALGPAAANLRIFAGQQVLRIVPTSESHVKVLQQLESDESLQLDFWRPASRVGLPADVRVPVEAQEVVARTLQGAGLSPQVMIPDIELLTKAERAEMAAARRAQSPAARSTDTFNYESYHVLPEINTWMQDMVREYPSLVSLINIGSTYENRDIPVLKIGAGGGSKPAIFVATGIHAREWVTVATGIWIAKKLVSEYGQDSAITSLLNTMDWYFEIVANPDGYVYTHERDRMWRKTRSQYSGNSCVGTDPNRNFAAGFGGPGSSSSSCTETYRGPSAHSESEVQAIVNFVQAHPEITSFIDVHSYSQMLIFPFGYKNQLAPDHTELNNLAKSAVTALTSLYNTKYTYGPIITTIYQASGGSIDWTYEAAKVRYSYCFELRDTGRYGFILPANQILPTAQETWLAIKVIAEHVRDSS
ncbi:carboxypeptidase A1-like [Lampetra fluviatilis]